MLTRMRVATRERRPDALSAAAARLERAGASLTVCVPGREPLAIGARPGAARVVFHHEAPLRHLRRGDALGLAEAYLGGAIDLDGDMLEIMKFTEIASLEASLAGRIASGLRWALRGRRRRNRDAVAFHYDRPVAFFLPWLDRWRSYSHGLYRSPDDGVEAAQARKLQYAIDALELRPGMRVLDVGSGWGSFLEYAGLRGIEVHGLTISREQHRFCRELLRERGLPGRVEMVDFFDYRPERPFDAVVFMGTLEHVTDHARVARFLARSLTPRGRIYADFCAQRESFEAGAFLKKHIWPASASYVNVAAWVDRLLREGFHVRELADDTLSYAYTVRDWAQRLEGTRKELADEFGEAAVRTFLLFLWSSCYFLFRGRTQAYHLVAAREPAPLRG